MLDIIMVFICLADHTVQGVKDGVQTIRGQASPARELWLVPFWWPRPAPAAVSHRKTFLREKKVRIILSMLLLSSQDFQFSFNVFHMLTCLNLPRAHVPTRTFQQCTNSLQLVTPTSVLQETGIGTNDIDTKVRLLEQWWLFKLWQEVELNLTRCWLELCLRKYRKHRKKKRKTK